LKTQRRLLFAETRVFPVRQKCIKVNAGAANATMHEQCKARCEKRYESCIVMRQHKKKKPGVAGLVVMM